MGKALGNSGRRVRESTVEIEQEVLYQIRAA
jgi:hypothetical protein